MTKDSNKKDVAGDAHDTLVKSLESIKDLLMQSETKISAARESIAKAGMSNQTVDGKLHQASDESTHAAPIQADEQAPSFDLASSQIKAKPSESSTMLEVPLLDDIVAPGEPEAEEPPEAAPQETIAASTIERDLKALDDFQAVMEDKIHKTVVQAVIKIEERLKSQLERQVELLRRKLKDGD